jgi:hypothetical protein
METEQRDRGEKERDSPGFSAIGMEAGDPAVFQPVQRVGTELNYQEQA